jgi:hypothetical protein
MKDLSGYKGQLNGDSADKFWWHIPANIDLSEVLSEVQAYYDKNL